MRIGMPAMAPSTTTRDAALRHVMARPPMRTPAPSSMSPRTTQAPGRGVSRHPGPEYRPANPAKYSGR